jgi:hypothetical protein
MKVRTILFIGCWSLLARLQVHAQAEKVAVFEEFGQPEGIYFGNGTAGVYCDGPGGK